MTDEADSIETLIAHNIEAVKTLRDRVERGVSKHQRFIEIVSERLGSPVSVFVLVGAAASWITFNLLAPSLHLTAIEGAPFYWLQGAFTLYAGTVATIVLAAQNRQRLASERRAHFELQVNLLAEQRTAKIIALLEELRRDLPNVKNRVDLTADALQVPVHPHLVAQATETPLAVSEHEAEDRSR